MQNWASGGSRRRTRDHRATFHLPLRSSGLWVEGHARRLPPFPQVHTHEYVEFKMPADQLKGQKSCYLVLYSDAYMNQVWEEVLGSRPPGPPALLHG